MTTPSETPSARRLALLLPPALAAILLLADLGGSGLWEPHETRVLEAALAPSPTAEGIGVASPVTRLLARAATALLGRGESAARLPGAVLCWLAILLVHLTLALLGNPRIAAFGTLALASSTACLFHGRQLTGDAPLLLAQTAATAGLALAAFAPGRRAAVIGATLAALGLIVGSLEAGLLAGAVLPAGTVLVALALTGDLARGFSANDRPQPRRVATAATAGAVTILAAGAYLAVMLIEMPDVRLVTGGLAAAPFSWPGFDDPLAKLAYGWFPWVVVVPLALLPLLAADRDGGPAPLLAAAIAGIAVGYLVQVADTTARGPGPLFLCLPMAAAVGLALERLETSRAAAAMATVFALVFTAVLIRDFAQTPGIILSAHGFERVAVPADFAPVLPAALASLPFAAMLALLGFLPDRASAVVPPAAAGTPGRRFEWRRVRGSLLAPAAAAAFGGWIAFAMIPGLSRALSPKHALDDFAALRSGSEPLAILGENASLPDAERLSSTGDLVRWLGREDRVLALVPPKQLAAADRAIRQKQGRHLHVLARPSERFLLATNRPRPGEANDNPLVGFVFLGAFASPPRNALEVDFDGKVTLLGWDLRSGAGSDVLERGGAFSLATYWRCDAPLAGDYRIFLHIEGPGPRINGDHAPVRAALPTREWRPGDFVVDLHEGAVPSDQAAGRYTIRTGLFRGDTRLRVTAAARDAGNAAVLGTVEVK
jgi:hypothetical protein